MSSPVPPEGFFRESKTLHRSTQELSLQVAELDAAMSREEFARFNYTLGAQQKVRIAAAIALAVISVFVREGELSTIAISVAVVGAYLFTVLRMGNASIQSMDAPRRDMIPLAIADAVV